MIQGEAQDLIEQRTTFFDGVELKVLSQIANIRRSIRVRAVDKLIAHLDRTSERDNTLFQTIPLEFIEIGDYMGAIWYLETIGKLGHSISFEVFERVFSQAISESNKIYQLGDKEAIVGINKSIESLLRMAKNHPDLSNNSKLYVLVGNFEELKGDTYKALSYYDAAIQDFDIDGYLASATSYERIGQYQESLIILESGYGIFKDIRFLGKMIEVLCNLGRHADAYMKYQELGLRSTYRIPPFLFYKKTIENDEELGVLESIVAQYILEGSFIPVGVLTQLCQSASYYIFEQIGKEGQNLQRLNQKSADTFTSDDYTEYTRIIIRRMYLMQFDILTLGDSRFLENYLGEIHKVGIHGNESTRRVLYEFFSSYFSEEVKHCLLDQDSDQEDDLGPGSFISNSEKEFTFPDSLFEMISLHVFRIGEIFYHADFYNLHKNLIVPILRDSAIAENEYDEEMEDELVNSLKVLKNQSDYYHSLRASTRKNYEEFIKQFDKKYGEFFRRHLQSKAIDPNFSPDLYPEILSQNLELGFLFWLEKAITGNFPTNDPSEIEEIIDSYALDTVSLEDALLLGSILYDISEGYTICYLVSFSDMLEVPEAIYLIMEGLRGMGTNDRKEAMKQLNTVAKNEYGARGFFEHVSYSFRKIHEENPSDDIAEYMLLAKSNMAILQRKDKVQSILGFQTAGFEYGSIDGFLQAGESFMDMKEYEHAIIYFEQAFGLNESIKIATKILNCAICAGKFDQAQQYIDFCMRKEYDIGNYIIAFYLWQGKWEPAFLQTISMIRKQENIIDMPEGLLIRLIDTLNYILKPSDSIYQNETSKLHIYASFILCNLKVNDIDPEIEVITSHLHSIVSLFEVYEGDDLHGLIKESLSPMTGDIVENLDRSKKALSDEALEYLEKHISNIFTSCEDKYKKEENEIKRKELFMSMNRICATVIHLSQKFPNSEHHIKKWINKLQFVYQDGYSEKSFYSNPSSWIM